MTSSDDRLRPRTAILIAAAVVFVVGAWVPFGRELLYPLTLFTTWVHEMGHGVTALGLGGQFDSLDIYRDAGGQAAAYAAHGWPDALVAIGGLLAPPVLGAALLAFVHGPRRARTVLAALAVALVVSTIVFVRTPTGVIAMPVVALALGWAAWRTGREYRAIVVQVLGVVLALDTLTRMVGYAFETSIERGGKRLPSDVDLVVQNVGGLHVMWGLAISGAALGLLATALWWACRRSA